MNCDSWGYNISYNTIQYNTIHYNTRAESIPPYAAFFCVIFWYQSQPVVILESDILYFSPRNTLPKFSKILEIASYFLEYTHKHCGIFTTVLLDLTV